VGARLFLDVLLLTWILAALWSTQADLRSRRQTAKLGMYATLTRWLARLGGLSLAHSLLVGLADVGLLPWPWQAAWLLHDGWWSGFFLAALGVLAWVWAPNERTALIAARQQVPHCDHGHDGGGGGDGLGDEEEEEGGAGAPRGGEEQEDVEAGINPQPPPPSRVEQRRRRRSLELPQRSHSRSPPPPPPDPDPGWWWCPPGGATPCWSRRTASRGRWSCSMLGRRRGALRRRPRTLPRPPANGDCGGLSGRL
jgi:hypothetical protein